MELIFTVGSSIKIGDDVTVKIVRVETRHGFAQVRLGISAPQRIAVYRQEVAETIARERDQNTETEFPESVFLRKQAD